MEFNTFPSSKSQSHNWHKIKCDHATALRMTAIYGANGAGKSNLVKCLSLLRTMVAVENFGELPLDDMFFKFDENGEKRPSEIAVEFFTEGKIFYYHIAFDKTGVIKEELLLSKKNEDVMIFRRDDKDVNLSGDYLKSGGKDDFIEVFMNAMNRIIRKDMLALSFFGKYYFKELPVVKCAYDWIVRQLQIVFPDMQIGYLPHLLDSNGDFAALVNTIVPEMRTGIYRLGVRKDIISDEQVQDNILLQKTLKAAKENPGKPQILYSAGKHEISNVIVEEGVAYKKTLTAVHHAINGGDVELDINAESDGTRRLIEYMPLIYSVLKRDAVFVVDEIERSLHPIMVKTIMSKLSENNEARGQLVFTTHESCLLDQSVFRPDEIWFAQKDVCQSTRMYPLSDFNIHKTANIENGYLNGRYGGIPFLSNLADLKW